MQGDSEVWLVGCIVVLCVLTVVKVTANLKVNFYIIKLWL